MAYLVADDTGFYQIVTIVVDVPLKNTTEGVFQRRIEVKYSTITEPKVIGSIINAGRITDLTLIYYSPVALKFMLSDDTGKVHIIDQGDVKRSIPVSDQRINFMIYSTSGAVYFFSRVRIISSKDYRIVQT